MEDVKDLKILKICPKKRSIEKKLKVWWGPILPKKATILGKKDKFKLYMVVYSIIQEHLQKILNKNL